MNIYIIEHLDKELFEWCLIEYKSISKIVGKDNVWFTNIESSDADKLKEYGKVFTESVKTLKLYSCCILDPESEEVLQTKDAKEFKYFIFGGILGDNPPRKRTQEELTPFIKNGKTRNIGKEQFSTDNAVFVVNEIIKGKKLEEIPYQDEVEIEIDEIESTSLPYRYPLVNGKPRMSEELLEYIKRDDKI